MNFGNAWGWLALAGLPALVWIYLHQHRRREIWTNLSFLLPKRPQEAVRGRKLERWRRTRSFWWLATAILLAALLLAQPRLMHPFTRQQVAVVLDSSYSMAAFRKAIEDRLAEAVEQLDAQSRRTEWLLLESQPGRPNLYRGGDRSEMLAAAGAWQPATGAHDPTHALLAARQAVGSEGIVLWVTDQTALLPTAAAVRLAVGRATPQAGFAGVSIEAGIITALVRNYSDAPTTRPWWVELPDGTTTERRILELPADGLQRVRVPFPEGISELTLRLTPDAFALDDALPVVRPSGKELSVQVECERLRGIFARVLAALPEVTPGAVAPDLLITCAGETNPHGATLTMETWPDSDRPWWIAPTYAEEHPLIVGLNWDGLLLPEPPVDKSPPIPGTVLVWKGTRPLISYDDARARSRLALHFDPARGNFARLPASVLLMSRFAEEVRARKPAFVRLNAELGEPLGHSVPPEATLRFRPLTGKAGESPYRGRAPTRAGFFHVGPETDPHLTGASAFADVREADLRACASDSSLPALIAARDNARAERVPWLEELLLLALGGCLLGGWYHSSREG